MYNDVDEDDNLDIDVCVSCGRYYSVTPMLTEKWRNSFNYRPNSVMDQLCFKCMGP